MPPISIFTGENVKYQLEEWLPSLERASTWNVWSEEDKLIQLAIRTRSQSCVLSGSGRLAVRVDEVVRSVWVSQVEMLLLSQGWSRDQRVSEEEARKHWEESIFCFE